MGNKYVGPQTMVADGSKVGRSCIICNEFVPLLSGRLICEECREAVLELRKILKERKENEIRDQKQAWAL